MARRRIDLETGEQDLKGVITVVGETKAREHDATGLFKTTRAQLHSPLQAATIFARLAGGPRSDDPRSGDEG